MNAVRVLRELHGLGVRLDVRGEKVHYDAPAGVMTSERLEQLRTVKPHLVELLAEPITHQRAPRKQWCDRCRRLESQGIRVLACSVCDRKVSSTG